MIVIIFNRSRKKSFRTTKRMISLVLPPISNRVNIGDVPKRVLIKIIEDLKKKVNRGTSIKVFFESKVGYHGFKCIEIGKTSIQYEDFTMAYSLLDKELKVLKIITDIQI